jgi:hypothetical protein
MATVTLAETMNKLASTPYMSPAKNLGGEGSKENFRGGGSKNFMKFYSRFVKISRVGQKMPFFCQIFPFFAQIFFRGVIG